MYRDHKYLFLIENTCLEGVHRGSTCSDLAKTELARQRCGLLLKYRSCDSLLEKTGLSLVATTPNSAWANTSSRKFLIDYLGLCYYSWIACQLDIGTALGRRRN